MSVFRSKLARFNTICCQQIIPVPVIPLSTLHASRQPDVMYPLPLPFNPQPEPYCPPSIISLEIGVYPPANEPPVGTILSNPSNTIPTNYLQCNGAEISRTTYSTLFNVIGTYYGDGNLSTTFNLPNLSNDCNSNLIYIIKYQ
jgi:hypothetical protein